MVSIQLLNLVPDSEVALTISPFVLVVLGLLVNRTQAAGKFIGISTITGLIIASLLYFIAPIFDLSNIRAQLVLGYGIGHATELFLVLANWGTKSLQLNSSGHFREVSMDVASGVFAIDALLEIGIVFAIMSVAPETYFPALTAAFGVVVSNLLTRGVIS
jgi:hypothetical protein